MSQKNQAIIDRERYGTTIDPVPVERYSVATFRLNNKITKTLLMNTYFLTLHKFKLLLDLTVIFIPQL